MSKNDGNNIIFCCSIVTGCLCCTFIVSMIVAGLSNPSRTCFDASFVNISNNATFGVGGSSVALTCAGQQVVVGVTSGGDGIVEVAQLAYSNNSYVQTQTIEPPILNVSGAFGTTIATDCHAMLAVGEPLVNSSSGRVHLFNRSVDSTDISSNYAPLLILDNPEGISSPDLFGLSLAFACHAPWLAVGAPAFDADSGRVYIFSGNTTTWSLIETIDRPTANITSGMAQFGAALALSCDAHVLVVGAPNDNRVAVFARSDTETPFVLDRILSSSPPPSQVNSRFGASVAQASRGSIIVVGAPLFDSLNETLIDAGAVFRFDDDDANATSILEGTVEDAHFGRSVSVNHDATRLLVGDNATALVFQYSSSSQYTPDTQAFAQITEFGGERVASSFGGHEMATTLTAHDNSTQLAYLDCWKRRGSVCPSC